MVKTGSLPSEGGISWLFAFRGVSHLFTLLPIQPLRCEAIFSPFHLSTFSLFHLFTFNNE